MGSFPGWFTGFRFRRAVHPPRLPDRSGARVRRVCSQAYVGSKRLSVLINRSIGGAWVDAVNPYNIAPIAYRLPPTAYRLPPTAYRLPPVQPCMIWQPSLVCRSISRRPPRNTTVSPNPIGTDCPSWVTLASPATQVIAATSDSDCNVSRFARPKHDHFEPELPASDERSRRFPRMTWYRPQ